MMMALACAPAWAFEWKSTQRQWTLGLACTVWVLSWVAVWKLTSREVGPGVRRIQTRRILRLVATAYLPLPYFVGLTSPLNAASQSAEAGLAALTITVLLCGLVATPAFFVHVAHLAKRSEARIMPMEARILAVLNVLVFIFALLPELDGAEDSLSMLLKSPTIEFGPINLLRDVVQDLLDGVQPYPLFLLTAVVPIWSAVVMLRLAVLLRRSARRAANAVSLRQRALGETQPVGAQNG